MHIIEFPHSSHGEGLHWTLGSWLINGNSFRVSVISFKCLRKSISPIHEYFMIQTWSSVIQSTTSWIQSIKVEKLHNTKIAIQMKVWVWSRLRIQWTEHISWMLKVKCCLSQYTKLRCLVSNLWWTIPVSAVTTEVGTAHCVQVLWTKQQLAHL